MNMESETQTEIAAELFLLRTEEGSPYFGCGINDRAVYFNPTFVHHEGKTVVEIINLSPEILELTTEDLIKVKEIYNKYNNLICAFLDLTVCNFECAYSLPLLKKLLEFEVNEIERAKIQSRIDEYTYIYLIKDTQTNYTKIGRSDSPYMRLKNLIRQDTLMPNPNDFFLLCCWQDYPEKERELHREYESNRKRGEWFDLSESDIKKIIHYYQNRTGFESNITVVSDNE